MGLIKDILRTMDYGPSPESNEHVRAWLEKHEGGLRPFHRRPLHEARRAVRRLQSRDRASARRRRRKARAADVDAAVAAARKALPKWAALSGDDARAPSLCARPPRAEARALPRGAGEHRQRQADPRIARHRRAARGAPFLSSRRLGGADRHRIPRHAAGRRLRADHSVELPAADAGLEDRAGAGGGQYGRPEAGRIHAADRARLRRNLRRGGAAAGRRQHRHRRRRDRGGARRITPASTRSPSPARPRSAARSARRRPARGKKLSLELGGKSPFVVFEDADLDSAVEGVVDAIWFNQGQVCCAGSRLLAAEGVAETLYAKLQARGWRICGSAIPSTSRPTSARSSPRFSSSASSGWCARRRRGARPSGGRRSRCRTRLLLSADAGHRRRAGLDPGAGGDLRPGAGRDDLPHARRGGGARQQHALRPRGVGLDGEHQPRARRRRPHQGGRRLDQLDQPVRRRVRLRRLSRERLRPRGRPRGPDRVPRRRGAGGQALSGESRPLSALPGSLAPSERRRARPHRQALCRRQAGAARFRLQLRRPRSQGRRGRPRRARQPQGHPQRGRGRGQGFVLGRGDRA